MIQGQNRRPRRAEHLGQDWFDAIGQLAHIGGVPDIAGHRSNRAIEGGRLPAERAIDLSEKTVARQQQQDTSQGNRDEQPSRGKRDQLANGQVPVREPELGEKDERREGQGKNCRLRECVLQRSPDDERDFDHALDHDRICGRERNRSQEGVGDRGKDARRHRFGKRREEHLEYELDEQRAAPNPMQSRNQATRRRSEIAALRALKGAASRAARVSRLMIAQ